MLPCKFTSAANFMGATISIDNNYFHSPQNFGLVKQAIGFILSIAPMPECRTTQCTQVETLHPDALQSSPNWVVS